MARGLIDSLESASERMMGNDRPTNNNFDCGISYFSFVSNWILCCCLDRRKNGWHTDDGLDRPSTVWAEFRDVVVLPCVYCDLDKKGS